MSENYLNDREIYLLLYESFCKAYGYICEEEFNKIDYNTVLMFNLINSKRYKV